MEFKKCERCGCFFVSNNNTCSKCTPKDEFEITKLKNYFESYKPKNSLEEISNNTGITVKNLDRHMNSEDFKNFTNNLSKNDNTEYFVNL